MTAIAETSAATDVHDAKRPVKPGDLAYLSLDDAQALVQQRTLSATRQYPVVVAFSEGDPLDEEVREEVPRPPSPAVNRASGRIGFDYLGTVSHGTAGLTSSNLGLVLQADITRSTVPTGTRRRILARPADCAVFLYTTHLAGPAQPYLSPGHVL